MIRKFLVTVSAGLVLLAAGVAGCGVKDGDSGKEEHIVHSWSEIYIQDGDCHYQTCSGCDEKKYGSHDVLL